MIHRHRRRGAKERSLPVLLKGPGCGFRAGAEDGDDRVGDQGGGDDCDSEKGPTKPRGRRGRSRRTTAPRVQDQHRPEAHPGVLNGPAWRTGAEDGEAPGRLVDLRRVERNVERREAGGSVK